ncbi:O-antigen ligase family protein [Arenicella sp. 4NH20-0111]|uniref:O-antigen ligase family protein n=1 Tax=Arenicella sp. 4NH20-0111 TaxID=3127648 RepID=UPI003341E20C
MIWGYIQDPVRQSGLLLDYSQSSFFLLLIYGYLYHTLKSRQYFPLLTFIVALAIFTSFSRTTNFLLAVFILSLIVFRVYTREHSIKGGTIIAIVFAFVFLHLLPVILGSDAVDRGGLQDFNTLNSRTQYWSLAWQAIMEKPLLGHGLGNFEYLGAKDSFPNQKIFFVHNDYLQIWMELGVIWFFLFIYSVGYLLIKHRQVIAIPLGVKGDLKRYIDWVMLCCCAAYMAINFIIGSLIFLLLIALIIARLTTYGEN